MTDKHSSASRNYVAICRKTNFDGYYFRKFVIPEEYENTVSFAEWYFLNKINFSACIEFCITFEDYQNIENQKI